MPFYAWAACQPSNKKINLDVESCNLHARCRIFSSTELRGEANKSDIKKVQITLLTFLFLPDFDGMAIYFTAGNQCWGQDKLYKEDIYNLIMETPLSSNEGKDWLVWIKLINDSYFIKEGYQLLFNVCVW